MLLPAFASLTASVLAFLSSAVSGGAPPDSPAEDEADAQAKQSIEDQLVRSWIGTGDGETWSPHRLNYFAVGKDDLKMQLSYKYRAARDVDFYVAFTSLIMWDVYEDSLPYRDITFQPEFFYRLESEKWRSYSIDLGYWHNSNGEDGPESRAWDRFFARGIFRGELLGRDTIVIPTGYITAYESDKNGDIDEYLGNWEVNFIWRSLLDPETDDLDLTMTLIGGRDNIPFDRGQFQAALHYRIPGVKLNPRVYLQYFSGYGDTLLEYNKRNSTLRIGLAF